MKVSALNAFRIVLLAVCLLLPGYSSPAIVHRPEESFFSLAFSPHGESLELALSCIRAAKRSIQVAAYSFTSKPVAQALTEAHQRGVTVQMVADKKGNRSRHSAVTYLADHGVPVRLNGRYAILHHKFMVIDGQHVQTGSFNYSAAAVKRNAENVLVLRDVLELAEQYADEWQRLWDEAEALPASY